MRGINNYREGSEQASLNVLDCILQKYFAIVNEMPGILETPKKLMSSALTYASAKAKTAEIHQQMSITPKMLCSEMYIINFTFLHQNFQDFLTYLNFSGI